MEGVEKNTTRHATERPLSSFTVELEVYSGPYEGLLALIMRDEVEIFEVPLRELVALYMNDSSSETTTLERDTDFVDSATSLVLLKCRALAPALVLDEEEDPVVPISPEELERRLLNYLEIKRAAELLGERLSNNAGFHPSAHFLPPRPGRVRVDRTRLDAAAKRAFSRTDEPEIGHLGPITVTVGELAARIQTSLAEAGGGPIRFEDLVRDMDRLHSAVAFAATLSLASNGSITLRQNEPLGPLTLDPAAT